MKRSLLTLFLCLYVSATTFAFLPAGTSIGVGTHQRTVSPAVIVHPSMTVTSRQCQLFGGFLDDVGNFMKRFTSKATASHILVKGGAEAENKLEDLKVEIGDSPIKFAEAAAQYSECPSASSGGNLGEFGPGAMVKEFDQVVFKEQVGKVHGPIKTQFGYHLIYISERTE
jgi:peptidyl-prolyl cis-trans isomerase C